LDAPRPIAPASEIAASTSGYITAIDGEQLGRAVIAMGGGRQRLGDAIDHSTGFEILARIGDRVDAGQPLMRVFDRSQDAQRVRSMLLRAIRMSEEAASPPSLVLDRIHG
jgi:thymidine phosphorylase